jgi:hypothetical protein
VNELQVAFDTPVGPVSMDKVFRLEESLLANFEQPELPLRHHFAKGVYARELFIPKGMVIVGKIHKHSTLNILSKGDISVTTDEGVVRVQAPFTVVGPPGTKRVGYAHEDSIWTTIHGTDETDLEVIETLFIAKDFDEYRLFCEQLKQIEETTCLG